MRRFGALGLAAALAFAPAARAEEREAPPAAGVAERLAAIRAAGDPVTLAEMAGPPVPDAQNAAVIYREIGTALETLKVLNGGKNEDLSGFLAGTARRPQDWDAARGAVARAEPVFAIVEEAVARPRCRFPVKWEDGYAAKLPHLAQLRRLCYLLCTRAIIDARDGKAAEAMRSVARAYQVAGALHDEPLLISLLVRIAILRSASLALREVTTLTDPAPADVQTLAAVLTQVDLQAQTLQAMKAERAAGLWAFDHVRKGGLAALAELDDQIGPPQGDLQAAASRLAYLGWGMAADEIAFLDRMERQIQAAHLPWRDPRSRLPNTTDDLPRNALLTRMILPALGSVGKARDRGLADLAGSRALLALLAYRGEHGAYPRALSELAVQPSLPLDPFSGQALVYRQAGQGFLLYSVGEDLTDDGGRPIASLESIPGAFAPLPNSSAGTPSTGAPPPNADKDKGDITWWRGR